MTAIFFKGLPDSGVEFGANAGVGDALGVADVGVEFS